MPTDPLDTAQPLQTGNAYGAGAIAFHWTMFLLVVVVGILGLLHDDWPKATQGFWINVHALLGLLFWFTLFARLFWRVRHALPAPPEGIGAISRRLSSPVHWVLYALMFPTPILGVVTFICHRRIFDFGLFHIDFGVKEATQYLVRRKIFTAICSMRYSPLQACTPWWHCAPPRARQLCAPYMRPADAGSAKR